MSLDGVDLTGANLTGAHTTGLLACPLEVPGPTWRCIGAGTAYVLRGPYVLPGPGVDVPFAWCTPGLEGLDLTGANISTMCALSGCDFAGVHFERTTCPDGRLSDDHGGDCAVPIACPATGF